MLRNDRRSQLSLIMYEFFSSSPTFSNTDLAQAIYMVFRGSPKLCLVLSVTSFIDSLHTHTARNEYTHTPTSCLTMSPRERMSIQWECLAFIDVLCAVAGSAQYADFARLRCAILEYSKICRLRIHLQFAQIQQMRPNRRAGPLMKIVCISSSDRTFKITICIFTGQNLSYPIGSTSKDTNMLLALLDKPVQPDDVQQKRSRPEEHYRNSCILWKTKLYKYDFFRQTLYHCA